MKKPGKKIKYVLKLRKYQKYQSYLKNYSQF